MKNLIKVLYQYFSNPLPDVNLPYITMEWRNIRANLGGTCPDIAGLVDLMHASNYTAYSLPRNQEHNQGVPNTLNKVERSILINKLDADVLWAKTSSPALFW